MKTTAKRFKAHMAFAHEVEKHDPRGLTAVVRILARSILADVLRWRMESVSDRPEQMPHRDWLLFQSNIPIGPRGERLDDLCPPRDERRPIDLAKHVVLPSPWDRDRLARSLARIGPKRKWGAWKHDDGNHYIQLWEPIGIGFGLNGNHSLVAGVVAGAGASRTASVRDIAPLYAHVTCDGRHYLNVAGKPLGPVNSPEFGAIFEIGRLLAKHGISAFKS